MSNNLPSSLASSTVGLEQLFIPNKQPIQMVPSSSILLSPHLASANKRTVQMLSVPNVPGTQRFSAPNKRKAVDPLPGNPTSRKPSVPSKRPGHMEPSPKGRAESFESVRSKMRESLAAALALVSEQQNVDTQTETASTSQAANVDSKPSESASTSTTADAVSCQIPEKPLEIAPPENNVFTHNFLDVQNPSQQIFPNDSKEDDTQTTNCDGQDFQLNYVILDEDIPFSNNFLMKDDLLQGNGLCWVSDFDIDIAEIKESPDTKRPKLENEVGGNGEAQAPYCPQTLANKIEAELFKVHGGVNKKYKEKGRSLLFNLKDPSNPDLRESVISGEISPERLCSMTAEELASKELSQWRIAKAEELAQMVVLPESEVDIRRLVRKTHKGEFQVEFEQDDGASVEVTVGDTLLSQFRPKAKEPEPADDGKAGKSEDSASEKANLDDQSGLTTLSSDGTDLMQGIVIDEMKDADFLPPIVSLDEFMESLDSEPPFKNLPLSSEQPSFVSDEQKISDVDSKLESSDPPSVEPVATKLVNSDKLESKNCKGDNLGDNDMKETKNRMESETPLQVGAGKGEPVWEGTLQLNVSSVIAVGSYFKSGEKTSAKEWPNFLDIKGRVRLDAFEKFLQDLRMSRSRAIMVLHFCLKEESPKSGQVNLSEVVDSYIADERVGFAEPAPGFELYLCPPHARTVEMLGKHLTKDQTEMLNALDNGLIGIVVWRKALVTISPNSSSHHKHSSKKQHHSRRQQEKDRNLSPKPQTSILGPPPKPQPPPKDEPVDDIPPGFGPGTVRDDDDLPEFDFVRGSNLSVSQSSAPNPSHSSGPPPFAPPEQMRQLIHKYGHSEYGSNRHEKTNSNRPNWPQNQSSIVDDDDDDDIPEWQPQQQMPSLPLPPPPPPPPQPQQLIQNFNQQMLQPQMVNHHQHLLSAQPQQLTHQQLSQQFLPQYTAHNQVSIQTMQSQLGGVVQGQQSMVSQWQPGTGWAPQPGSNAPPTMQGTVLLQPCNNSVVISGQPYEGQYYGTSASAAAAAPLPPGYGTRQNVMDWRPDASRNNNNTNSRGF